MVTATTRSDFQAYVQWVRHKESENRRKARGTYARHVVVRGAAAVGAIMVPILLNLHPADPGYIVPHVGTFSRDFLQALAAWISFLVAIGIAIDGMLKWGDLYQNFLSASYQYENELHAFDAGGGDYRKLNQDEQNDLFLKRTTAIYTAERAARVSFFMKGTSGEKP